MATIRHRVEHFEGRGDTLRDSTTLFPFLPSIVCLLTPFVTSKKAIYNELKFMRTLGKRWRKQRGFGVTRRPADTPSVAIPGN